MKKRTRREGYVDHSETFDEFLARGWFACGD